MKAMVIARTGRLEDAPLELRDLPQPLPGAGEILVRVSACGVCHTELDEIEGRTPPPRLPVVPGHQVVGTVVALGDARDTNRGGDLGHNPSSQTELGYVPRPGDRVGVAWIHSACGQCAYCQDGQENLCPDFRATGRDANGGYAEYMTVSAAFAHPLPEAFSDSEAAPLLCAGAVGYRSLRLAGLGLRTQSGVSDISVASRVRTYPALGLTGFGASGHLVLKMVQHLYPSVRVYVFARSKQEQAFARELGA
ncbi:hypothetical protein FJY70_01055, partial [candidate division WOR-3 bacterium]|nr:hypothetical protein [candidate division WOR-3 bacterium]